MMSLCMGANWNVMSLGILRMRNYFPASYCAGTVLTPSHCECAFVSVSCWKDHVHSEIEREAPDLANLPRLQEKAKWLRCQGEQTSREEVEKNPKTSR